MPMNWLHRGQRGPDRAAFPGNDAPDASCAERVSSSTRGLAVAGWSGVLPGSAWSGRGPTRPRPAQLGPDSRAPTRCGWTPSAPAPAGSAPRPARPAGRAVERGCRPGEDHWLDATGPTRGQRSGRSYRRATRRKCDLLVGAPSAFTGELLVAEALIALAQARRMLGRSDEAATSCGRPTRSPTPAGPRLPHGPAPCRDPVVVPPHTLSRRRSRSQVLATGPEAPGGVPPVRVVQHDPHALRSVYRKLDVHSLPAAISRARELNLID